MVAEHETHFPSEVRDWFPGIKYWPCRWIVNCNKISSSSSFCTFWHMLCGKHSDILCWSLSMYLVRHNLRNLNALLSSTNVPIGHWIHCLSWEAFPWTAYVPVEMQSCFKNKGDTKNVKINTTSFTERPRGADLLRHYFNNIPCRAFKMYRFQMIQVTNILAPRTTNT